MFPKFDVAIAKRQLKRRVLDLTFYRQRIFCEHVY